MIPIAPPRNDRLVRDPRRGPKPPRRTHGDTGYPIHRQLAVMAKQLVEVGDAVRMILPGPSYVGLRWDGSRRTIQARHRIPTVFVEIGCVAWGLGAQARHVQPASWCDPGATRLVRLNNEE